jgi:hypothetical protein
MANPCDYFFNGKKLTHDQFRKELKELPMSEIVEMFPSIKDEGISKIGWTTGEQQNERYDLSKQVDKLEWVYDKSLSKPTGTLYGYKDGKMIMEETMPERKLEDYVGKGVAENLLSASENDSPKYKGYYQKMLTGDEIKVGGKGMKGFYGSTTEGSLGIVGNVAKSLFKQEPRTLNIEVQKQDVKLSDEEFDISEAPKELSDLIDKYEEGISDGDYSELQKFANEAELLGYQVDYDLDGTINTFKRISGKPITSTQQSIDITPELKQQVSEGLPLFMASAPKEDFTEALNEYDNLIKNPKGTTEYIKKFGLEKIKKIKDITSNFGTYIAALEKSNYITKKIC